MLKRKILVDTDIGDDIDDLLALEFLLKREDVEIVGITTTFKNTSLRARQVKRALSLLRKNDIPVYAGVGKPLASVYPINEKEVFCQYTKELDETEYAPRNVNEGTEGASAVDFIVSMAEKYGDSLTVLGIGPLTNIALSFQKNEEAMKKINIIIMGGCFFKPFVEWNIECDYGAAEIVFGHARNLHCVGIDVTKKTEFSKEDQLFFFEDKSAYGKYRNECIRLWQMANPTRQMTLHDPLTAMSAVIPNVVSFEKRHISLCTQGEFTTGLTISIEEAKGPLYIESNFRNYPTQEIAVSLNKERFENTFQETLRKGAQYE